MMDYETFRDAVKEKFLSCMPGKYQGMEAGLSPVEKVNHKLDGPSLWRADGEKVVSPALYISDMYGNYLKTGDLQAVLREAADAMDKAFTQAAIPPLDMSKAEDNIIFQLVNTMQNGDMLQNMPHREFQDLSIIYRWVADVGDKGAASTMINNKLAGELGMDEERLFRAAVENTRRILPPTVKSMNEVMREIFLDDGIPPEMTGLMPNSPGCWEMPPEQAMWVISNERGVGGAASMLYEDQLHSLAESVGTDLYILPSSVHEVIAVSVDMGGPEELAQMVAEINMEQVDLSERLSNQVYHYDKDLRKITPATGTPNKRLDGAAAGPHPVYEAKKSR